MPFTLILGAIWSGIRRAASFFSRPPGSYVGLALALGLALWWFGQHEFDRGRATCEATHVKYVTREVVRQRTVVRTVVEKSDEQLAKSAAREAANREKVRTIYVHDKALPDASAVCVDPVDADRLRSIE